MNKTRKTICPDLLKEQLDAVYKMQTLRGNAPYLAELRGLEEMLSDASSQIEETGVVEYDQS